MSDMYGAVCSNEFKVKNFVAFRDWFDEYIFGDETELWVIKAGEGADATVAFGSEEQYPTAYPRVKQFEDPEATGEDDWYDLVEADLETFAKELREHLADREVFQVVAGGNEKLRYVGFSELIIAEDVPKPSFTTYYSDDTPDDLRARMATGVRKVEELMKANQQNDKSMSVSDAHMMHIHLDHFMRMYNADGDMIDHMGKCLRTMLDEKNPGWDYDG